MKSDYVEQRLRELGASPMSRHRRKQSKHASVELKREIRQAYYAKCPCCGTRPTQRQLAAKFGVDQAVVWRAVNEPIIDRFRKAHIKSSFRRISPLQVAAMLCDGVDEGRASA